ncbi:MAG: hypothetical protein SFW66_08190 [Gammaproteobacteria bacterium]|nr:hypothetical protein [Gammaproteobacteria bacterium]
MQQTEVVTYCWHCFEHIFDIFTQFKKTELIPIGIATYVVGGGLYFFNIIMFINKQFIKNQERIRGNYIYQIFVNLGGIIGALLVVSNMDKVNEFKSCFTVGVISLLVALFLYPFMHDDDISKIKIVKFYFYLILLFFIVLFAMHYQELTRIIVLSSFLVASVYVIFLSFAKKNNNLLMFVGLVFAFNIPYWLANTIIFNQFFYFLKNDVSATVFNPLLIVIIDPLVNILFGIGMLGAQRKSIVNHYRNLTLSSLLLVCAFVILTIGLFFSKSRINFVYPMLMIGIFACAEFLLQTTLNSKIKDLLAHYKRGEFLATGIMRSSRSFATVLGYFLISFSAKHGGSTVSEVSADFKLYCILLLVCLASFSSFRLARRFYMQVTP